MTGSARAFARTPPLQQSPESFALQAGDDIASIRDVHCAYACIEKLIAVQHVNDCEELSPTRSELSALVRLINDELHRRIEAAESTIVSLRERCAQ